MNPALLYGRHNAPYRRRKKGQHGNLGRDHGPRIGDRSGEAEEHLEGILVDGEEVEFAFKVIRDFFVLTKGRVILVDVQSITGSKVEYQSIPYRAITRFAVETAGTFDLDAELKIWVSGSPGPIQQEGI